MEKRWASIKLTLLLLYLGVLPLTPDVPLPFAFALLAIALVTAVPLILRFARTLSQRFFTPGQPSIVRSAPPGAWQLLRPVAPGTRGTVRSRAPSSLLAARG
ncbi:MAG: hypothetical protein GX814_08725 [Microbacteriaceae bacterium]|nr:hypothetical protein [Microbacteriaceae bacterium]